MRRVGIATTVPYNTNLWYENSTLFCFNSFINMIPAKAPIGVKNAHMFELKITENSNFELIAKF